MTDSMIERVATAIERADLGWSINLVKLVDGCSTYRVDYHDGSEPVEIDGYEAALESAEKRRRVLRARAAIEALREPTEAMLGANMKNSTNTALERWQAAIDAALSETT